MKLKKIMLIIFTLGSLFYACKRVNCPQLETQYFYTRFSVGDTSFIPYNGKDTLWFQDKNGNTMKLVCYEKFPYSEQTCVDLSENPDCGSFWNCQVEDQYIINFKTMDNLNKMTFSLKTNYLSSLGTVMYRFDLNSNKIFEKSNFDVKRINPKDSITFNNITAIGSLYIIDSIGLFNNDLGIIRFKDEKSIVWTLIEKK